MSETPRMDAARLGDPPNDLAFAADPVATMQRLLDAGKKLERELNQAQARLAEVEKDAERWQWCALNPYEACLYFCESTNTDTFGLERGKTIPVEEQSKYLRERIDAALKENP